MHADRAMRTGRYTQGDIHRGCPYADTHRAMPCVGCVAPLGLGLGECSKKCVFGLNIPDNFLKSTSLVSPNFIKNNSINIIFFQD